MGKTFGMPVYMANGYVVPAVNVAYFKMTKDRVSIYLKDGETPCLQGEPLTSCKPEQLGFGFFPDEPSADEGKKDESCIIKPV